MDREWGRRKLSRAVVAATARAWEEWSELHIREGRRTMFKIANQMKKSRIFAGAKCIKDETGNIIVRGRNRGTMEELF